MSVQQSGFSVTAPGACTAAAGTAVGLLTPSGVYGYKITFVTGFGETEAGTNVNFTATATGSVNLTAIPVSSNGNVISRIIYRTAADGSTWKLLATISDNTTTTYTDIIADGSLGADAPLFNTAGSLQYIAGDFKIAKPTIKSATVGITAGAGGTSSAAVQLTSEINVISTVTTTNDSVKLPALNADRIGTVITVKNLHANTARIYPFDGQQINLGGADTAITIATTVRTDLVGETSSNWRVI